MILPRASTYLNPVLHCGGSKCDDDDDDCQVVGEELRQRRRDCGPQGWGRRASGAPATMIRLSDIPDLSLIQFLLARAMLARYMLWSCVRLSVGQKLVFYRNG